MQRLFGQRWDRGNGYRPDSGRFQSGEELSLTGGLRLACLDELEDLVEACFESRVLGIEVFLRATASKGTRPPRGRIVVEADLSEEECGERHEGESCPALLPGLSEESACAPWA